MLNGRNMYASSLFVTTNGQKHPRPRALPQPRTRPARIQPARAGAGGRPPRAGARAPALPVHRRQQPRRILRDPRRRPERGNRRQLAAGADGMPLEQVFRQVARKARELVDAPVPGAQRRRAAATGRRGHPHSAPHQVERRAESLGARLFFPRADAGADADRASIRRIRFRACSTRASTSWSNSKARTPSAANRAWRSCRRRACCRA